MVVECRLNVVVPLPAFNDIKQAVEARQQDEQAKPPEEPKRVDDAGPPPSVDAGR